MESEKTIKNLESIVGLCKIKQMDCKIGFVSREMFADFARDINEVIDLLKEQEPKPPIHIHEEYPEHDWETDEDGNIDECAMDEEFHHGPACKRCGYSFCICCNPNGFNEEPCVIDYYQCPKCGERILKNGKNIEYCVNCGQAVKLE